MSLGRARMTLSKEILSTEHRGGGASGWEKLFSLTNPSRERFFFLTTRDRGTSEAGGFPGACRKKVSERVPELRNWIFRAPPPGKIRPRKYFFLLDSESRRLSSRS